ncbi:MAG: CBS domain-containing protein, partial [Kribbellaceae bacterium]
MSSPAVTVTADTPIKDALVLLDEHEITTMPVVDRAG